MRKRSYICMVYSIFSCCPVSVKFKEIAALSFSKRVSSNISHSALLRWAKKKIHKKDLDILEFCKFGYRYGRVIEWNSKAKPGFRLRHFQLKKFSEVKKEKISYDSAKTSVFFSIFDEANINRISIQLYRVIVFQIWNNKHAPVRYSLFEIFCNNIYSQFRRSHLWLYPTMLLGYNWVIEM